MYIIVTLGKSTLTTTVTSRLRKKHSQKGVIFFHWSENITFNAIPDTFAYSFKTLLPLTKGMHTLDVCDFDCKYRITGEVCFLLAGVYITYCIRNARTEIYPEKWTLCCIIYIELIVSSSTYILRHLFSQTLHPDLIFLLYFARCQLTVTLALFLLLFPKVSPLFSFAVINLHCVCRDSCFFLFSQLNPNHRLSTLFY